MSVFPNDESKLLARVILRADGSVHICFRGVRSIAATPKSLSEFFADPIDFIAAGSHTYPETTFEINRKRDKLDDVLGLTLARLNKDKTILLDFPELFSTFLEARDNEALKSKPLNMKSFELKDDFSDEKSYLIRYYLESASYFKATPSIKRNIQLREEVQFAILREILNAFFEEELPQPSKEMDITEHLASAESNLLLQQPAPNEEDAFVSTVDYAKIVNKTPATIYNYIKDKRIKSARKDSAGRWQIDKNDIPIEWDRNAGRKRKIKVDGKHYKRKNVEGSAADVEEHILRQKLFTAAVAPYIHTFKEMQYYINHNYHEVFWNGRPALIIDVNPEYISTKTGARNRDLMIAGKAPVVPSRDREEYVYHIHHVGQHSSSPFAIIPEYDHLGKEMTAYFHQGTPNTALHGPEFEAMKGLFWKTYIEEYDKQGGYRKIPYLNPRVRNK